MDIITKIANGILYAGLTPEEYNSIEKNFKKVNERILLWMSATFSILFLGLWSIAMTMGNSLGHAWILAVAAAVSAVIMVITKIIGAGNYIIIQALMYIFCISMYITGILIDGVLYTGNVATCIIALTVILPLAFSDRPIVAGGLAVAASVSYIIVSFFEKTATIWLDDATRLVAISVIGLILNILLNKFKATSMLYEFQNDKIQTALEQRSRELMAIHVALNSGDWSITLDDDGDVTGYEWSNESCRLLGYRDYESAKGTYGQWIERINPDDLENIIAAFSLAISDEKNDKNIDVEFRIKDASDEFKWFRVVGRIMRNSVGKPVSAWGLLIDVNQKRIDEGNILRQLAMVEALSKEYKDVFVVNIEADRSITVKLDGKMISDYGAHVRKYSGAWERYVDKYVHPDDAERVLATFNSQNVLKELKEKGEIVCTYRAIIDGTVSYLQANYLYVEASESYDSFIVAGYRNIDGIVAAEEEYKRNLDAAISEANETKEVLSLVEIDDLTGVYTRQAFLKRARDLIDSNPTIEYDLTITDFEDFKLINDQFGTKMGDGILRWFGKYIAEQLGDDILIGRYGGDQFAFLTNHKDSKEVGHTVIWDISGKRTPQSLPEVVVKAGVYISINPELAVSVMCDRAHMALHSIKHHYEKHWAVYDDEIKKQVDKKRRIELSMFDAVSNEQFKVYYQPKHDAKTGALVGAEALLRWVHPEYGFLSPGDFIPLFEKNGFITEADRYVWNRTCNNLKRWEEEGLDTVPVSVNVSRMDFLHRDFFEQLDIMADNAQVGKDKIHIEVTETLMMDEIESLADMLSNFKSKGYKIELDDFGVGYSSINILSVLPVDTVKLDMSFMKHFKDEKKSKILSSCIDLSHKLGLETISEGVETEEQLDVLNSMGVDTIQGYYFSKPLPETEFEEYLKNHMNK